MHSQACLVLAFISKLIYTIAEHLDQQIQSLKAIETRSHAESDQSSQSGGQPGMRRPARRSKRRRAAKGPATESVASASSPHRPQPVGLVRGGQLPTRFAASPTRCCGEPRRQRLRTIVDPTRRYGKFRKAQQAGCAGRSRGSERSGFGSCGRGHY